MLRATELIGGLSVDGPGGAEMKDRDVAKEAILRHPE